MNLFLLFGNEKINSKTNQLGTVEFLSTVSPHNSSLDLVLH